MSARLVTCAWGRIPSGVRLVGGLALGLGLGAACVVIDPGAKLCSLGEQGCSCTLGGACDAGLTCSEDMCVDLDDPGGTTTGGPHETDDGDDPSSTTTPDDEDSGEDTGANTDPNYVFVTSTEHTAGAIGGLEGADAICQARADAAGLPGTYRAWLSGPGVDARDRLAGASGWIRPDGRPFARDLTQILDGRFYYPLLLDEKGAVPQTWWVWTGTTLDGLGYDDGGDWCAGWTSNDGELYAVQGDFEAGRPSWTESFSSSCANSARLYCFGVDHVSDVTFEPTEGRRVFVTGSVIASGGGVQAADGLCQGEAATAGLQGSFRALLATSDDSPASRFDLDGPPWVRMDGVPVFAPGVGMSNELQTPIVFRANGAVASSFTWFGSASVMQPGTVSGTCDDWTSTSGSTPVSSAFHVFLNVWFDEECSAQRPVLCFEE